MSHSWHILKGLYSIIFLFLFAKLQVRGVNDQIEDCLQRIEEHKAEKENLDLACQDLQRQFKKLVQDNKFVDFLRRIFKKKYRPPRDRNEDGNKLFTSYLYHIRILFMR